MPDPAAWSSGYRLLLPVPGAAVLAAARKLVAASGTRGTTVTVIGWTDDPTISPGQPLCSRGPAAAGVPRPPAPCRACGPAGTPGSRSHPDHPGGLARQERVQLLRLWLSCGGGRNHGFFCSRSVDRAIAQAHEVEAANPETAAELWARVDRAAVDEAAWVPLVNPRLIDFVSARVRNYQHHPYLGIIADQLVVE